MSIIPGIDQEAAVLARVRGELKKTVLEAATPRAFTDWEYSATGGYGLDLTTDYAAHWPEHWTSGALATPTDPADATEDDPLCPVFEAYGWRDLETDAVINGAAYSPFTAEDLRDRVDDVGDTLLHGCGFLLVNVEDDPGAERLLDTSQGRDAGILEAVRVEITGRLPAGRRRDQAHFYCALLGYIFRETKIKLSATAFLDFQDVPATGEETADDGQWLEFLWVASARRHWVPTYPFSP